MANSSSKGVALSIVIPSFRQAKELEGALQSIDAQTFRNFEVLVVDAGSDETVRAVIDKFSHLPIKFTSEPDKGIYDAMNKGIEKSAGDYLYFMGCDDRLASPNVLSLMFDDKSNTKNDFLYGNVIFTSNNSVYDGKFGKLKLIHKNICHQAIFVKRAVFNKLGKYNPRYKYLADWVFNMECFSNSSIKKKYINVIVALYNNQGSSFSNPDYSFAEDRGALERRYFPMIIRYIHYRKGLIFETLVNYL